MIQKGIIGEALLAVIGKPFGPLQRAIDQLDVQAVCSRYGGLDIVYMVGKLIQIFEYTIQRCMQSRGSDFARLFF